MMLHLNHFANRCDQILVMYSHIGHFYSALMCWPQLFSLQVDDKQHGN